MLHIYYYNILLWDYKAFKNHINPQRNDIYQEQYAIIDSILTHTRTNGHNCSYSNNIPRIRSAQPSLTILNYISNNMVIKKHVYIL